MGRILRAKLVGEEAQLGRVPAADFARLLLGAERAIARSSGHVIGRRVKPTGRWGTIVARAARLRLVAIEEGSVVSVLALPEVERDPDALELDVTTLGELALGLTLDVASGTTDEYPDVAKVIAAVADEIGVGSRYEAVVFEHEGATGHREVRVDAEVRQRLRDVARRHADRREDTVTGVLVEADFESHTARLRSPTGGRIVVSFAEELADDIQDALRQQAQFVGEVTYDEKAAQAVSVDLREITRADQLIMGLEGDFWRQATVEELREEQDVEPVWDVSLLYDDTASDEEVDAFFAGLDA